jgi:hypothetical protein
MWENPGEDIAHDGKRTPGNLAIFFHWTRANSNLGPKNSRAKKGQEWICFFLALRWNVVGDIWREKGLQNHRR